MTITKRNVFLIFLVILFVSCLLCATFVGSAETSQNGTDKCFVYLSGLSAGNTRVNNPDGADTAKIYANALYLSMDANHLDYKPFDGWNSDWLKPLSAVKLDGTNLSGARLIKYGANDYYLTLSKDAQSGSKLVIDGVFYNDANSNGKLDSTEQSICISPALFVYNGDVWSQVRPDFTLYYDGKVVQDLCVLPDTDVSRVTAKTNGSVAQVSVPQSAQSNGKFVLQGEKSTVVCQLTLTATYQGVKFEQYVDISVGYPTFEMKNGASIALFDDGGLRFGATLSTNEYTSLINQGYTFGCVMIERSNFDTLCANGVANSSLVSSAKAKTVNCDVTAMGTTYLLTADFTPLSSADFTTQYVGIVYAQKGSNYIFANFYQKDVQNNTRSCYYVAQLCADTNDNATTADSLYVKPVGNVTADLVVKTIVYGNGTPVESVYKTTQHTVGTTVTVDAPQLSAMLISESQVQQKIYVNGNQVVFEYVDNNLSSFGISAWFLPYLTEENQYLNEHNFQIVSAMKQSGLNTVLLNGDFSSNITSQADVERARQLIALFDSYGIKSYVDAKKMYFALGYYPDFSDCSGFAGIMQWDEPSVEVIDGAIATYAELFDKMYGDSAEFLCNLFPSEANEGAFGQIDGVNATYSQYLERYCTSVLSKISGTKILSVDSYPIYADYSIDKNFLTSIGLLKYYAKKYNAKANICLQSCGWNEGSDIKSRMPTEAEMRLQAYAALAFGMDSVSWFTYSQFQSAQTSQMVPVDYQTGAQSDGYTALKNVNNELLAFADVYADFDWQGAIFKFGMLSAEKEGYTKLNQTEFSEYVLDESSTQFSDISVNGFSNSVIAGVFNSKTDANVQGYAFCNYASLKDGGKTATVTLKTNNPLTLTIYSNGTSQTVNITNSYELTLQAGAGCFITCTHA